MILKVTIEVKAILGTQTAVPVVYHAVKPFTTTNLRTNHFSMEPFNRCLAGNRSEHLVLVLWSQPMSNYNFAPGTILVWAAAFVPWHSHFSFMLAIPLSPCKLSEASRTHAQESSDIGHPEIPACTCQLNRKSSKDPPMPVHHAVVVMGSMAAAWMPKSNKHQ